MLRNPGPPGTLTQAFTKPPDYPISQLLCPTVPAGHDNRHLVNYVGDIVREMGNQGEIKGPLDMRTTGRYGLVVGKGSNVLCLLFHCCLGLRPWHLHQ